MYAQAGRKGNLRRNFGYFVRTFISPLSRLLPYMYNGLSAILDLQRLTHPVERVDCTECRPYIT